MTDLWRWTVLIVLYSILLIGGMWLVGESFNSPILPGLVFIAGVLCLAAAVAVPVAAQRMDSDPPGH
ncbi:hypothetical protein K0817_006115 [Microbacterium sp. HD4P20]|uniref:hypothetical protein n=1 Tax=Microbacterium sp. HD4P20 TaxID=2864874 RepID=UPI001C64104C|nr:hypothetical protein [Microbacterium sp. HD4P20]MCP2636143.1 hypothetical protein [Microbacterium sp. HD4P20]